MATSFKPNKDLFAEIVEININPKILFENSSPLQNNKYKKKYKPFHKKINSANNPSSKFKENKNLNSNQTLQSQTMSHTTIETPEITTRYKPVLDKLNTNICSLKNKYQDLIRQNFSKKERINSYKIRFLKLKKEAEEEKKQRAAEKREKEIKAELEEAQELDPEVIAEELKEKNYEENQKKLYPDAKPAASDTEQRIFEKDEGTGNQIAGRAKLEFVFNSKLHRAINFAILFDLSLKQIYYPMFYTTLLVHFQSQAHIFVSLLYILLILKMQQLFPQPILILQHFQ
jgi:hypothetical protein